MSEPILNLNELVEKVDKMKKDHALDLSSDQDLSIAIMNLVSIEEHFFFTGAKTGNPKYYDFLNEIREMRKSLLKRIIKEYEGEVWCISKHLLAASYRLMEVGTKAQGNGKKEDAQEMFQKAYDLYSLFWGLNMKLIDLGDVKKIDDDALNNEEKKVEGKEDKGKQSEADFKNKTLAGKLGALVKKVIDCCIE
ncbi:MAG: hypothetical protein WC905_03045 [Patescibacteria group bacterium]|jgi:hypothetical protein